MPANAKLTEVARAYAMRTNVQKRTFGAVSIKRGASCANTSVGILGSDAFSADLFGTALQTAGVTSRT